MISTRAKVIEHFDYLSDCLSSVYFLKIYAQVLNSMNLSHYSINGE
jgi:hypothetical protein